MSCSIFAGFQLYHMLLVTFLDLKHAEFFVVNLIKKFALIIIELLICIFNKIIFLLSASFAIYLLN